MATSFLVTTSILVVVPRNKVRCRQPTFTLLLLELGERRDGFVDADVTDAAALLRRPTRLCRQRSVLLTDGESWDGKKNPLSFIWHHEKSPNVKSPIEKSPIVKLGLGVVLTARFRRYRTLWSKWLG